MDVAEEILISTTKSFNKVEIVQTVLKLGIAAASAYFTFKWMLKQIDPPNKYKINAAKKAREICRKLGIDNITELSEYELLIASHLMDPSDIKVTWNDIGGLSSVIQEIKETVIFPIQKRDLFSDSMLTQPPKGVLLHGPPGCGKTMIAKATAHQAGTRFINLDVSILTDKWYGESQKLAAAVFSLAVKLQPCIIFIDEIDSFLRSRNSQDHEVTAMMKAQFMTLWDGLVTDWSTTVIIMGATNRPLDLDKAILRRLPATFHIGLPDESQRADILKLVLNGEPINSDVNIKFLAKHSEGFSGSDLKELCRTAASYRITDFLRREAASDSAEGNKNSDEDEEVFHDTQEYLRPISNQDFTKSLKKMKDAKLNTARFLD